MIDDLFCRNENLFLRKIPGLKNRRAVTINPFLALLTTLVHFGIDFIRLPISIEEQASISSKSIIHRQIKMFDSFPSGNRIVYRLH